MELKSMLPVRKTALTLSLVALFLATLATSAHAAFGVTSVAGGTLLPGPPPPSVLPGINEAPSPIVFPEVLNGIIAPTILNPLGLDVDHDGSNVVAAPTISGNVVNPALVDTTIPVGTAFNSYLFHFDPVAAPFFSFYVTTIKFDNPILGVQLFSSGFTLQKPSGTGYTGTLEQGDTQIALNGGPPLIYYPGVATFPPGGLGFRGVEEDAFVLAIAGNTVMIAGSVSGPEIDQIRILTAPPIGAVPEPATAMTWALITLCCGGIFARRRQLFG
jgi:hypothetical protein